MPEASLGSRLPGVVGSYHNGENVGLPVKCAACLYHASIGYNTAGVMPTVGIY